MYYISLLLLSIIVRASPVSNSGRNNGDRGNVLVHELWNRGEQTVLNTQAINYDAPSQHAHTNSEKILEGCARVKKAEVSTTLH